MPVQDSPAPYASSHEHLLDELARIDVLLRARVAQARAVAGDDPFRGLSISEADVDALLHRGIGQPHWLSAPAPIDVDEVLHQKRALINARALASRAAQIPLRLDVLAKRFSLTSFDIDVLLITLATEIDTRYERLFGYLHDDVTQKQPRIDLVLSLLCPSLDQRFAARNRFVPNAPLLRHGLVQLSASSRQTVPLLSCALKIDERIVEYLHDSDDLDTMVSSCARKSASKMTIDSLLLPPVDKQRFADLFSRNDVDKLIVYLQAPPGHSKKTLAEATTSLLRKTLLVVDGQTIAGNAPDTAMTMVRKIVREARLADTILYWDHFDLLLADAHEMLRRTLLDAIAELPGPTFLAGELPWEPADVLHNRRFVRIEIGFPAIEVQTALWQMALQGTRMADAVDLGAIARRYRLNGGLIRDAVAMAKASAFLRSPNDPCVNTEDLSNACRFHTSRHLSTFARKVETNHQWDDLVLPRDRLDRLREICNQAQYRDKVFDEWGFDRKLGSGKGLSLMFTGPPGTGKTMTAAIMAKQLGLDLHQIDLASVVSKYIGETEKHLARIFSEAERSRAILFFDEADALFGKRTEIKDAHDRFANIEISYLLQRIEAYQGVVILATNFSRNIDDAFVRRIQFIVEFTLPDEKERLAIWERIWPDNVPREANLDLPFMAKRFEIAGAHIRNIALAAAFLAAADESPVNQKHLLHATRREYQKMGKVTQEGMFVYRQS